MRAVLFIPLLLSAVHGQWFQGNGPIGFSTVNLIAQDAYLFAETDHGIFRSSDDGAHWHNLEKGFSVWSFAVAGPYLLAGGDNGVFRSEDRGMTWTRIHTGLTDTAMRDLAVQDNRVYAGNRSGVHVSVDYGLHWSRTNQGLTDTLVRCMMASGGELFVGTDEGRVFRSTDRGLSWNEMGTVRSGWSISSFAQIGESILAVTLGGTFRSRDRGATWTPAIVVKGDTLRTFSLLADGSVLFAGTELGLYRSEDQGSSWSLFSDDFGDNVEFYSIIRKGTYLFAGSNFGMYRSADMGATWTGVNTGVGDSRIYALAASGSHLYASVSWGLFHSSNSGDSWSRRAKDIDAGKYLFEDLSMVGSQLFLAASPFGLFRSPDHGATLIPVHKGLDELKVHSLETLGGHLFAGMSTGVFRSSNLGETWKNLTQAYFKTPLQWLDQGGGSLFAGATEGTFRSRDSGLSWERVKWVNEKATPTEMSSMGPYLFAGTKVGVFRSSDEGVNWTRVLSSEEGDGAFVSFTIAQFKIFAGTRIGRIFVSSDSGATWQAADDGLHKYLLYPATLTVSGNNLFAGTEGLWKRPVEEIGAHALRPDRQKPAGYGLAMDGGRILRPGRKVEFSLVSRVPVSLALFDMRGRRVATLVEGTLDPGRHGIPIPSAGVPDGLYQLRLRTEGRVDARTVLIRR